MRPIHFQPAKLPKAHEAAYRMNYDELERNQELRKSADEWHDLSERAEDVLRSAKNKARKLRTSLDAIHLRFRPN